MTQPKSYARRFVRSAWTLLAFQLVAALGAAAVTGWAAFYVADLRAERDALRLALDEARPGPSESEAALVEEIGEEAEAFRPDGETPPPRLSAETRAAAAVPQGDVERASRPAAPARVTPRLPERSVAEATAPASTVAAPRRRNSVYPGGLPGQSDGAEPPTYYPGERSAGSAPSGRDSVPDLDLGGIVRNAPTQPTPTRTPSPTTGSPNQPTTAPPNQSNCTRINPC